MRPHPDEFVHWRERPGDPKLDTIVAVHDPTVEGKVVYAARGYYGGGRVGVVFSSRDEMISAIGATSSVIVKVTVDKALTHVLKARAAAGNHRWHMLKPPSAWSSGDFRCQGCGAVAYGWEVLIGPSIGDLKDRDVDPDCDVQLAREILES